MKENFDRKLDQITAEELDPAMREVTDVSAPEDVAKDRIKEKVLTAIGQKNTEKKPNRARILCTKRVITALAACLCLCLVVTALVGSGVFRHTKPEAPPTGDPTNKPTDKQPDSRKDGQTEADHAAYATGGYWFPQHNDRNGLIMSDWTMNRLDTADPAEQLNVVLLYNINESNAEFASRLNELGIETVPNPRAQEFAIAHVTPAKLATLHSDLEAIGVALEHNIPVVIVNPYGEQMDGRAEWNGLTVSDVIVNSDDDTPFNVYFYVPQTRPLSDEAFSLSQKIASLKGLLECFDTPAYDETGLLAKYFPDENERQQFLLPGGVNTGALLAALAEAKREYARSLELLTAIQALMGIESDDGDGFLYEGHPFDYYADRFENAQHIYKLADYMQIMSEVGYDAEKMLYIVAEFGAEAVAKYYSDGNFNTAAINEDLAFCEQCEKQYGEMKAAYEEFLKYGDSGYVCDGFLYEGHPLDYYVDQIENAQRIYSLADSMRVMSEIGYDAEKMSYIVAEFGAEAVAKYYSDGIFHTDAIDEDIAYCEACEAKYAEAKNAYEEYLKNTAGDPAPEKPENPGEAVTVEGMTYAEIIALHAGNASRYEMFETLCEKYCLEMNESEIASMFEKYVGQECCDRYREQYDDLADAIRACRDDMEAEAAEIEAQNEEIRTWYEEHSFAGYLASLGIGMNSVTYVGEVTRAQLATLVEKLTAAGAGEGYELDRIRVTVLSDDEKMWIDRATAEDATK